MNIFQYSISVESDLNICWKANSNHTVYLYSNFVVLSISKFQFLVMKNLALVHFEHVITVKENSKWRPIPFSFHKRLSLDF